jgi:iron(III) transport system permease protein
VSRVGSALAATLLAAGLVLLIGWPLLATVLEASHLSGKGPEPATGGVIDPAGTAAMLRETGGLARPARLAIETIRLVAATELLALAVGIPLALLLFRTDVWGRNLLLLILVIAAFVPLPLHATAWLGALGNAGRMQAIGVRPILVGRIGAAIIHALAALPWVVLLAGVGFRTVEAELEESASLDLPPWNVLARVTLRRSLGVIAAVAVAVAVLTSGDMTVTDLLLVRTYAEEAFVQFTLGRGPADAAIVSIPPLLVLGASLLLLARAVRGADPARLASAFARSKRWELGAWRVLAGWVLVVVVGNFLAFPLYSLIWRAGRVGGRAELGQPPSWSLGGLLGTLRFAASEIREPIVTSLVLAAIAATVTTALAWALAWKSRRRGPWQVVALGCLALTLAAPGPVAGMAMELAYLRIPSIYDSWIILAMAQSMRTLPYALLVLWPALRVLPRELLESASVDGLGEWGVVRRVALPLSARAILAAWAVTFILGFGELPATNLLQPPGLTTITFRIWTLLHTGVESHLAGVALVTLSVITVLVVLLTVAIRLTSPWDRRGGR